MIISTNTNYNHCQQLSLTTAGTLDTFHHCLRVDLSNTFSVAGGVAASFVITVHKISQNFNFDMVLYIRLYCYQTNPDFCYSHFIGIANNSNSAS